MARTAARIAVAAALAALGLVGVRAALAQPADAPPPAPSPAADQPPPSRASIGSDGYFAQWFDRVGAAQASQPHWMTPIVTVTPRLEQEVRYDFYFERLGNGADLANYGAGKGLELIPTTSNEILLNLPPYEQRTNVKPATGLGDDPIFLVKQRFLSANEESGNYIVTGFFGVSAPIGVSAFSNNAYVLTPTLAGGKGWGPFDVQATLGVGYPLAHEREIGVATSANIAFQYHFGEVFWPELEVNTTYWGSGLREGKVQTFLTPGIIFGRFPIAWRLKAIVGVGYQIAVTPKLSTSPVLTPTYDHALVLTSRMAF